MMFAGRLVVRTTLDPIPPLFRAAPGVVALTVSEIAALERNDAATFKRLMKVLYYEDKFDLERAYGRQRRRRKTSIKGARR